MFSVASNNFWNTSHNRVQKILKLIIQLTASVSKEKYKTRNTMTRSDNDDSQHVCVLYTPCIIVYHEHIAVYT
jgi:hypothetical protein